MSQLLSNDSFEIIDDPTEIISHRANAGSVNTIGNGSHGPPDSQTPREGQAPDTGLSRRKLPQNFLPSSSSTHTERKHSGSSLQTNTPASSSVPPAASTSFSNGSSARVWNPPPRPRDRELKQRAANMVATLRNGEETMPMVGGSGARVPNRFLDDQGKFENDHASSRHTSDAIDLTNDDGSTDGEGDEPQITAVKSGDVEFDEARNNGPVCLGVIAAIVLCMYGLPDSLVTDGPGAENPHLDTDPLYARENWPKSQATGKPALSHWWSQPGYRPVVIRPAYPSGTAAQSVQRTAGQWSYGGNQPAQQKPKAEVRVMTVLSPMAHMQKQARMGIPPHQRSPTAQTSEPFGALSDKFTNALEPLITRGLINMEARCKLTKPHKQSHFLHSVELLTFCTRPNINYVIEALSKAGISIDAPQDGQFCSDDYPGKPPLITGHHNAPAQALFRAPSTSRFGIGLGGSGSYVRVQTREMTDNERRKQIETVYDQLVAGEELPLAEASPLIKTHLFSHQRQGVNFLLERERERSFDEIGYSEAQGKGRSSREDSISLWQVKRSRVDSVAVLRYKNIVTQHEQEDMPQICRGAILADDMGLGKTITVIATIASTVSEALAFSREPLGKAGASHKAKRKGSTSGDDGAASEMASRLQGLTAPKKARRDVPAAKKPSKQEKLKIELNRARDNNLVVKSRATLIVCPLTIVSNWEEQIKEHWAKGEQPRIYVYHGSSRSQNPKQIADYDIVMTTYSTLASEFANQRTWDPYPEDDAKRKDKADDDDDDDDDFQMVDSEGKPASGAKGKGTKKRKRFSGKEAYNPLQRIEWFRVVLDEAHTIKEARTMQCKAVCNLTAQRRISLTGTPVQNRLDDLYSQIKFLRLEPFADRAVWNEHCGQRQKKGYLSRANKNESNEPIEQVALVKVQTIMKFLTLRRTKDSKTPDGRSILEVPPKCTRLLTVSFDNRERTKYKELHERYREEFKEMQAEGTVGANYATILQEILNLRMCCDHSGLVDASKDSKRLREGKTDLSTAIKEDGLTRERAARLFAIFCESDADMANCSSCQRDLSSVEEVSPGGGGGGGLEDDGDDAPGAKPVVTKCNHLFCSKCFGKAVGARWKRLASLEADERAPCPVCDVSLSLIMDVIQLEASDLASVRNASRPSDRDERALSSTAFGVDKDVKVDDRVDLSSKVRFLLSDLLPFSACNPHSLLYDPEAPQLKQHQPTPEEIAWEQRENDHKLDSVCVAIQDRQKPKEYEPIRSVIFSQWTSMLDRVQGALHRAGIRSVRLDGKMKRPERAAALEAFKNDKGIEVFLISLRAGGFGLNLVSACRAYCVEPAWNPAVEQQAMDRIHRLGQLRPVIATKLITKSTIEEKMLEIQKRKQDLAQKVGEKRTKADEKAQRHEDLSILLGEH